MSPDDETQEEDDGMAMIIGIVVGVVVLALLVTLFMILYLRRKPSRVDNNENDILP